MQAIILAGGQGTRLRSSVPDLPKPLAPVGDRPFLEHQMRYWIARGIDRFVLSVGYKAHMIIDHFGCSFEGAGVSYAVEESPMGTGGGVFLSLEKLTTREPFLVLNGDSFFDIDLTRLLAFHRNRASDWTCNLFRTSVAGRYMGVRMTPAGRITALNTGKQLETRLANGGVYLVSPGVLERFSPQFTGAVSLENDVMPALLAGSPVYGIEQSGRFIDIGIPADYHRAASVMAGKGM